MDSFGLDRIGLDSIGLIKSEAQFLSDFNSKYGKCDSIIQGYKFFADECITLHYITLARLFKCLSLVNLNNN